MTEESQWTKDHEAHIAQLKKRIHFLPQTEHERYIYGMWLLLVAAEVAGHYDRIPLWVPLLTIVGPMLYHIYHKYF